MRGEEVPSWHDMTSDQRAAISNGCGGKGGWFRPPQFRFRASCDRHDFGYWIGGDESDRRWCDARFLGAMVADAVLLPIWKRPFHLLMAYVYYRAVRAFGSKFFKYGEKSKTRHLPGWSPFDPKVHVSDDLEFDPELGPAVAILETGFSSSVVTFVQDDDRRGVTRVLHQAHFRAEQFDELRFDELSTEGWFGELNRDGFSFPFVLRRVRRSALIRDQVNALRTGLRSMKGKSSLIISNRADSIVGALADGKLFEKSLGGLAHHLLNKSPYLSKRNSIEFVIEEDVSDGEREVSHEA